MFSQYERIIRQKDKCDMRIQLYILVIAIEIKFDSYRFSCSKIHKPIPSR